MECVYSEWDQKGSFFDHFRPRRHFTYLELMEGTHLGKEGIDSGA